MSVFIADAMAGPDLALLAAFTMLLLIAFGLGCLIVATFINDRDRYRGGSDLHDG